MKKVSSRSLVYAATAAAFVIAEYIPSLPMSARVACFVCSAWFFGRYTGERMNALDDAAFERALAKRRAS